MDTVFVICLSILAGTFTLTLLFAIIHSGFFRSTFRWTRKRRLIARVEAEEFFSPTEVIGWRVGPLSGGWQLNYYHWDGPLSYAAECEATRRYAKWRDRSFFNWLPVRHMPATHRGDTVPSVGCTCGFYAWKTQDFAIKARGFFYSDTIIPYALSGIVIEHERGYRAQYARRLSNKEVREIRMEQ